jgi:prepilin-type N-terminal cleavage/methylation domain-containing protein/prepilin-type processing-associated H-X9-DG protein
MSNRPKVSPDRAFTLIELLVVIAIIGTLAALLNTGIAKAKASAQSTLCKNNLRQLGGGLEMFVSEFNRYPINSQQTQPASSANSERFWMGQLARDAFGIAQPTPGFHREGVWRCPSAKWSAAMMNSGFTQFSDFGYNDDKFSGAGPRDEGNKFGLQGHFVAEKDLYAPIAESEVAAPSEMMAIADCFEGNGIFMRKAISAFEDLGNIRTRHGGKMNVVFCDGHIETPRIGFVFEDTSEKALRRWNRDNQPHLK